MTVANFLMSLLPSSFKYPVTVIFFYPTILSTRLYCFLSTLLPFLDTRIRLWNRVNSTIVLGVAPVLASDVAALHSTENVSRVVNLCREWNPHERLYAARGMTQLYLPTTDFEPPTLEHTLAALALIEEAAQRGESVYVHCKAGRGRSVCIVLAHLVMHHRMSPVEAEAFLLTKRVNIVKGKWRLPLFEQLLRLRGAEAGSSSSSSDLPAATASGAAATGSASPSLSLRTTSERH